MKFFQLNLPLLFGGRFLVYLCMTLATGEPGRETSNGHVNKASDDIELEETCNDEQSVQKADVVYEKPPWSIQRAFRIFWYGYDDSHETRRHVRANDPNFNRQFMYCDNSIKTSRYNIFTFLPFNLFEQFMRFANVYFLILAIMQGFSIISPVSAYTTAVPLVIVLSVTACKDGYDDFLRHKSDRKINNHAATVLRSSDRSLQPAKWQDIHVGEIVRLKNNEAISSDMLLLSSSDSSGLCFVETADLDGETNLKYRQALMQTQRLDEDLERLAKFDGEIQCERPNSNLNKFDGNLAYQGETFSLNNSNIMLRGCIVRNTTWAYGLVIFTGQQSKLMQNAGKSRFKRTRMDQMANKYLLSIFGLLIVLLVVSAVLSYMFESGDGEKFRDSYSLWMDISGIGPTAIALLQMLSYLIIIQTVIPISLYVSFEMVKIVLSRLYVNYDVDLYYPENDTAAMARTTTLSEELGQIGYIFSDKTGTLTRNIMTFNKCSIAGKTYGDARDPRTERVININALNARTFQVDFSEHEPTYYEPSFQFFDETLLHDIQAEVSEVRDFFLLLALCHTVNAEMTENDKLIYKAQSPDEAALVGAARNFGFVYKCRTPNTATIQIRGVETTFDVLAILDFDNIRKRMSVVVEKDGRRRLLCKGADTGILELLAPGQDSTVEKTKAHLNEFAGAGLRTLCCAIRELSDVEWMDWSYKYQRASTALDNRESQMFDCYCELEKDLMLIGATAVEDKLQEGVPETIFNLAKAGIKIWVLTGDKQETAISIGYSCSMLRDTMEEFIVDAADYDGVYHQLRSILSRIEMLEGHDVQPSDVNYNTRPKVLHSENYALVINGQSLLHALTDSLEDLFLNVACSCQAVICCRVAPLQKGKVVALVKRKENIVTLAIGDGANDVNMIKTAHIGIGLSGQEGMQAVLSSDYSFGQFRFLQRLLLVHGRWSYIRVAYFLRYFFYKNFAFTLCHYWFGALCGWSATSVYEDWFITLYNVIYTSTPIICYAWMEQDVNAYYSQSYPKLYYPGPKEKFFSLRFFILACVEGIYASAVTFVLTIYSYSDHNMPDGRGISTSHPALGVAIGTIVVFVVTIRCSIMMTNWTYFHVWPLLSILGVFVVQLAVTKVMGTYEYLEVAYAVWQAPTFWLTLVAVVALTNLPAIFLRLAWNVVRSPLQYRVQGVQRKYGNKDEDYDLLANLDEELLAIRRGAGSLRRSSGFAFSQQSGYGSMISRGVLRESTARPNSGNSIRSLRRTI